MLFATGACSAAPDYVRPTAASPATYKEVAGWQAAGTKVPPTGRWWEAFADPVLSSLEDRVSVGNQDLAAAVARYDQARAIAREARADLVPQVGLSADVSRDRVSSGRPLALGSAAPYTVGTVGASLAYELDLFGRVRSSVRASRADADASRADIAVVTLGLQAQLAGIYFDMRGLDARIVLLRQTVEANLRAYRLTDTRHEGGIASGIDVSRAQNQLSSARAELSAVAAARQRDEHAVAVLIGEAPAEFALAVEDRQLTPPPIAAGLPSTLLERRPDIAAAERRVAAANARIGVARAALFPTLTLGATGGFEAARGSLLSAANGFWALGPLSAALSVFDGGRRRAGVQQARAEYDEAAASYRQTVLTAFREVEDALASQRLLAAQERDQRAAAEAAERTRELALVRYRDGAADYLEVVTAQTAALDAERALLTVRSQQLQTATDLVRALGGGVDVRS
ncbi:efflux transporter outer membrane subunit [Sphingomonas sp. MA1305]|uniref:efflux transporter outer membrane subunit n=1 Tax=Sphingomonas sp. MA1305 TaxID=2479204 RepID=UPI0018DF51BF|nr:efflux transporter outer membrane subunit [Sphingomonas sp. MA1305]MBI0476351.1 efflux transporter outer membrane subunit [Sphingomonas sp. MA1305]